MKYVWDIFRAGDFRCGSYQHKQHHQQQPPGPLGEKKELRRHEDSSGYEHQPAEYGGR